MNRPIVLIFSFYLSLFSCKQNQYADTIIYGGTIYTVDSINSIVEAVAIKDRNPTMNGRAEWGTGKGRRKRKETNQRH